MKNKFYLILLIKSVLLYTTVYSQTYKVEYREIASPLFSEDAPVICILEKDNALFNALGQHQDFTNRFTCYSSEVIEGLKDALQVEEFNPTDKNFQQALKDQLAVGYIIEWKSLPESPEAFQIDIYSTENGDNVYSNKMLPSLTSNAYKDAMKLIVENVEPVYLTPSGEIEITVIPESARLRLLRGDEIVGEWTGTQMQTAEPGVYRIIAEADNYNSSETEVEVKEGERITHKIELKPSLASLISVRSPDGKLSNLKTDVNNEQVKITYDYSGKKDADVKVSLLNRDSGTITPLTMVSGDVSKVKPGTGKLIFWEMAKELKELPTDRLEIQITAIEKGSTNWYYYAGGGAALLGGAAVLLLGGGGDDGGTPPTADKLGTPPGRP